MINLASKNDQINNPEEDASIRATIVFASSSPTSRRKQTRLLRGNNATCNNPHTSSGNISNIKSVSNHMNKLDDSFVPGTYDVICARGGQARNHSGNIDLKSKVLDAGDAYARAPSKVFKSLIVSSIVDWVRSRSPNGGFVKKMSDGSWYEVGDDIAREKVGQALRDLNDSHYKSSMKAKRRRWKKEKKEQSSNVGLTQPQPKESKLVLLPIQYTATNSKRPANHHETRFEAILRTYHDFIQSSLQDVQQKWIGYGGSCADEDQLLEGFTQHNTMLLETFQNSTTGGEPLHKTHQNEEDFAMLL